ncbi:RraA family protein [Flagellimonas sp. S3867]|uniref:RraA family protein n=1 Tax=Flagellimonas sp. S3867 TaxID=2768063 RepID=UPI001CC26312|nr:RraA family protein [Flagellimonas sp. S3867]
MSDDELFAQMKKELFSAVIGDVMDKMGFLHQFLPPQIQPLRADMILVGRAMPVLEADCYNESSENLNNPVMSKPFGLMLEALDDLKKNEVYICTGSSPTYALWGELMSSRAMQCGAMGTVVDGYSRDTKGILKLDFPTFSYGSYAQDQGPRGKVIDFRVPIEIQGVRIEPGDIVFGDIDGVCIIPQKIEKNVIEAALEKAKGEKVVQRAIENGMPAVEAFKKYGIM